MLNTVAVEVIQHGVPATRDKIARPVRGGFRRRPEALATDGHDTSLPRAGNDATALTPPDAHRHSQRWS